MANSESPSPLSGPAPDPAQAPSLCTRCGLCCTGAIHSRAVLDEDEIEPARAIGLLVIDGADRPVFSLPCPKLSGTECSIYGQRPRVCSRYQCLLLQNLEAGLVTIDEAHERVAVVARLQAELRQATPDGWSYAENRREALSRKPDGPVSASGLTKAAAMTLKLRATALEVYIDKFFRRSKDRKALELAPLRQGDEMDG